MTTYLVAAYAILKNAGQPLHYKEITERALEQNLIQPRGLTPDATVSSRFDPETKHEEFCFVSQAEHLFQALLQRAFRGEV